ncbi:hypothetical protein VM1G_06500 [Cytospora mali]|uniref:F-box domain-containing protein n=1 Tax=Cytospora mali TaxID=578113 RepID=A0A194W2E9_CYTMA|nr:hypothetical protein VM1G_06500 [Valsa mali]
MAGFDMLPFEVMVMILKNLSSPDDLASTIHASPGALAALRGDRRMIMTTIICKDLSPEVLKEAVSILDCPMFETGDDYCSIWGEAPQLASRKSRDWRQRVTDFESPYYFGAPSSFVFPRDMPIPRIIKIYRLRATINSLIADFVAYVNAMSVPDGPGPALYAPERTNLAPLTGCEISRIQLAFCRYELICRLTGLSYLQQPSNPQNPLTYCHWGEFFACFGSRHMEELGLVHNYVYSKYNIVFKEIDDDVTALLGDGHGPGYHIYRDYPTPARGRTDTVKSPVHVYITNLSKLGLGVLRWVLSRDRTERRRWICETFEALLPPAGQPSDLEMLQGRMPNRFPDIHAEFMEELDRTAYQLHKLDEEFGLIEETWDERDDVGWDILVREIRYPHEDRLEPGRPNSDDLCKLGWAFWDLQRLKQLGIITDQSTESNIVFNLDLRVQKTYQEQRDKDPDMPKLEQKVLTSIWEKAFKPQSHTTPSHVEGPEEDCQELSSILQHALDVQVEK